MAFLTFLHLGNGQQDRFATFTFSFCIIALVLEIFFITIFWKKLPPQIPLFYSRPWGPDILSSPIFIWFLPGFFVICMILNQFISNIIAMSDAFLVRTIRVFNVLLAVLSLWGTYKIISLLV